ncbi:MAG: ABC transporter permease [Gemmatimonadota bacterium]
MRPRASGPGPAGPPRPPWSVLAALRLYSRVQRALPADLVRAHGAEMTAALAARLGGVHVRAGAVGVWIAFARACGDVLAQAFAGRRPRGPTSPRDARPASFGDRVAMLLTDIRLAVRNLARRPGFTAVAALTLALGIGANTAMFAVVHSVLIRPLPFPEADRIVSIAHHAPGMGMPDLASSPGTLAKYREHARSFSHIAAVRNAQRNIAGGTAPARIDVAIVSPSLFDVLRVRPVLGRALTDADAVPGASPVAVLTQPAWLAHFGGAAAVIGSTLELDGVATEIVGVMPEGFAYPRSTTAALLPRIEEAPVFGAFGVGGIARLAPGIDLDAARAELNALQSRHAEAFGLPDDMLETWDWRVSVRRLQDVTVGSVAGLLWIVLGTVGFLLLVACASVANLFLVRGEARRREFGVRLALGATRRSIASALLSESLLVGLLGGACGVLLAWNAIRILVASGSPLLPRLHEVQVGATVLVTAAAASVVAGLLFGLLPLAQQLRAPSLELTRGSRGDIGSRDGQRMRRGLIVGQLALALVLLTGSGLMLRSFQQVRAIDPGLDPDGVLVVGVSGSERRDAARNNARYFEMLQAVRGVAGTRVAGLTTALPLSGGSATASTFAVEGQETATTELPDVVWYEGISDDYFAAIGTPVRAGRELTAEDVEHRRPVAIVNELFARTAIDGDAVGRRISIDDDSAWYEIVGVVADVRAFGLREDVRPMAFLPITADFWPDAIAGVHLVVRTDQAPLALRDPVHAAIRQVDPAAPVLSARTLRSVVDASLSDVTFTSTVLAAAALLALLLGAVGLYGVISYAVAERRSEIGVRVALGASPAAIRTMVLRDGLLLGTLGIAVGLAGAAALTGWLRSFLFQVSAHDPLTFVLVAALLLAVTLIATWLPASRAARTDPLEAIRGAG